jgi:hypothetical protein
MKRFSLTIFMAVLSVFLLGGGYQAAADDDVFLKEYKMVDSAEAVARLFVMTMIHYPEDKAEGLRRFTIMLSESNLAAGTAYNGRQPGQSFLSKLQRLEEKPYVARSYVQCARPENGYHLPCPGNEPWQIVVQPDALGNPDPNRVKLFIESTGADSARPITLAKEVEGQSSLWKVTEASSLFVGVRPPAK